MHAVRRSQQGETCSEFAGCMISPQLHGAALSAHSHACMGWNKAQEGGLHQFSHGLPYSGYHPAAPCLSSGGMYTLGSTFASGAVCAVSSGLQALSKD